MRRQRMVLACLLAFQPISCSRDTSTSPSDTDQPSAHPIAGLWRYVGEGFSEGLASSPYTCLTDQVEYDEETTDGLVRITLNLVDQAGLAWHWIAFNVDGTYAITKTAPTTSTQCVLQVPSPEALVSRNGTWTVFGAQLILIEDEVNWTYSQETRTLKFSAVGAQLQLAVPPGECENDLKVGCSKGQVPSVSDEISNYRYLNADFSDIKRRSFRYAWSGDDG